MMAINGALGPCCVSPLSSSAKAGDPVFRRRSWSTETTLRTGCRLRGAWRTWCGSDRGDSNSLSDIHSRSRDMTCPS